MGPKPLEVKIFNGFGFVEYDSVAVSARPRPSWREREEMALPLGARRHIAEAPAPICSCGASWRSYL